MKIVEYRIILPMTVEEYEKGMIYTTVQMGRQSTGGGEGVETITHKPEFVRGKPNFYTYKIYHIKSKMPNFVRLIVPKGNLQLHEETWTKYPKVESMLTNPGYLKERFYVKVDSIHLPGRCGEENALALPVQVLNSRKVVHIDIANDQLPQADLKLSGDPTTCNSVLGQRGPLCADWSKTCQPVMTAYKLITVDFKVFGLQQRLENFIHKCERRLITVFHRNMFCWMDEWYNTPLKDMVKYEIAANHEINEQMKRGKVTGLSADAE